MGIFHFLHFLEKSGQSIGGIGIYYPGFTPTQRVGVRVDYTLEPKINDIKKKIDTTYEEAIIIAKQEK